MNFADMGNKQKKIIKPISKPKSVDAFDYNAYNNNISLKTIA